MTGMMAGGSACPTNSSRAVLAAALLLVPLASAQRGLEPDQIHPDTAQPVRLKDVRIDQKLNAQLPLDLVFRDESGQSVKLGRYFHGKPVVLSLAYYECPMLCTVVLNGLGRTLKAVPFDMGKDFEVVTVSINPKETPALAAAKKATHIDNYHRPGAAEGWHFLTGDEPSIKALADAVGFRYTYDPATGQYAHAAGIMIATPEGKLARYFYGVEFPARDVKFGLMEAASNRIGSPVDQILLFCYHYDASVGKYTTGVMTVLRAAGIATVLALLVFGFVSLRRERALRLGERS